MSDNGKRKRGIGKAIGHVLKRRARALRDAFGNLATGLIPDMSREPVPVPVYIRPRRRR